MTIRPALLVLSLALASTAGSAAQLADPTAIGSPGASADPAAALPAQTFAYLQFAGLDAASATFRQASLVRLAHRALGADNFERLDDMARSEIGPRLSRALARLDRMGLDPRQLRSVLAGPVGVGMGRLTLNGVPMPSVALVCRTAKGAETGIASIERLLMEQSRGRLARREVEIDGVRFIELEEQREGIHAWHGVVDGCWLASNSQGYLRDCLGALRRQAPTLAANDSLRRARGRVAGSTMAALFINTKPLLGGLEPWLPYEAEGIARALGLAGAPDLYVGLGHDGKQACDVVYLDVPGPKAGMLKATFTRPVTNRAARWVRPDTAMFVSMSLDCEAAATAGRAFLEALPPAAARELHRELHREIVREIERETDVPLAELWQAFGSLGSEVSLVMETPRLTPPWVSLAAFVELRDPASAADMVDRLLRHAEVPDVKVEEIDGARVWSTSVRVEGFRMTPTVAIKDGWLMASNFKNLIRRYLRSGDLGEESLAADPRFRRSAAAAADACLFANIRLEPGLKGFWGLAQTGMLMGAQEIGLDLAEVPEAADVADAVEDIVVTATVDDHGFALRVQQPLGFGTLIPAIAAAIDWAVPGGAKRIY